MSDTSQNTPGPAGDPKIALCLSGGGLRATFFHLGLIRLLRQAGLLDKVTQISSVSGGSILAGHLVLNWEKYTGSDEEYAVVENELLQFGGRDIRGRIVRRWVFSIVLPLLRFFPSMAHRTFLLEREYARFFKDARLRDIEPGERKRPILHLLATSFTTGNLCSFSGEGFWVHHDAGSRLYRTGMIPLALAVASSSAFPPLFPPTAITRKMLDASDEDLPYDPEYLTDGGIFDNLGVARFSLGLTDGEDSEVDYLILSDAGGQLDWDIKGRFARVISRTIRSTDILMQRVADFTIDTAQSAIRNGKVFHVPMSRIVLSKDFPRPLLVDFQKKLPRVRTDLNRFTSMEIGFLSHHGYEVAWSVLKPLMPPGFRDASPEAALVADLPSNRILSAVKSLDRARTRGLGIFDARDWMSFALCAYLLVAASIAIFPYFYVARQAAQGELFRKTSPVLVPFFTDRLRDTAGEFGGSRATALSSGWATLHVPGDHKTGSLELPANGFLSFASRARGVFSLSAQTVNATLMAAPIVQESKQTLLFIHGFNTSFETALMRTGQIAWDTQYPGAWVAYSWPSKATVFDYHYDRESVEFSSAHFAESIRLLQNANAGKLDIIAEGMGGSMLFNSSLEAALVPGKRVFGEIIFLFPDIDTDYFVSRIDRLVPLAERITLFASTNSSYLRLADGMNGGRPRAGDGRTPLTVPNVDTIRFGTDDQDTSTAVTAAIASILNKVPTASNPRLRRMENTTLWDWQK